MFAKTTTMEHRAWNIGTCYELWTLTANLIKISFNICVYCTLRTGFRCNCRIKCSNFSRKIDTREVKIQRKSISNDSRFKLYCAHLKPWHWSVNSELDSTPSDWVATQKLLLLFKDMVQMCSHLSTQYIKYSRIMIHNYYSENVISDFALQTKYIHSGYSNPCTLTLDFCFLLFALLSLE